LDSDKNHGYALQWFGFAAIAAGAWLVIAWRALRRKIKSPTL
jgi:cytochrome oxidase assembly protein ShyY1